MDTIFQKINKLIEKLLVIIFALLVVDVLWQVLSRGVATYGINISFSFTEELARFSLIWLSILGAAYLHAKQEHLSMDFIYQKLDAPTQKKVSILVEVFIFLFALVVMVIGGFDLVYTSLHLGQLSGTLRVPFGYVYAILPISGLLMMYFSIHHVRQLIIENG